MSKNSKDTLISFEHLSSSPPEREEFNSPHPAQGTQLLSSPYGPEQTSSRVNSQTIPTSEVPQSLPPSTEINNRVSCDSSKIAFDPYKTQESQLKSSPLPSRCFTTELNTQSETKKQNFSTNSSIGSFSQATMNPIYMSPTSDMHFTHIPSNTGIQIPEVDILPSAFLFPEADRAQDAWIPSQATKEIFIAKNSPPGLEDLDKSMLTLPGIAIKEVFGDPVKNLMQMYLGEEKAALRQTLTASSVTQDDRGLRQLIMGDCLHAAVNLTTQLLTVYGQGEGRLGQPSKHTIHSVRLWFTRISLLVKLRRFSLAEVECQPFGNLDSPDLYFEFYPELYGGRKGSMIPFPFRLLVAELPQYLGKHTHSLDRIGEILLTCDQIIENLSKGHSEDGSGNLKPKEIEYGLKIWRERRVRTLYALTSCSVGLKDFRLANSLIQTLLYEDEANVSGLYSALGRLCLQLGDISLAQESFKRHLEHSPTGLNYDPVQGLLHSAYISSAENNFRDAKQILQQAQKLNQDSALVVNNLAVITMFLGEIREAIQILEIAIFGQPSLFLHEALVLNLATLYELESPNDHKKKLRILALISEHRGDGFNVGALKLQI